MNAQAERRIGVAGRGEETRQRLIAAAAELFGLYGFASVTTRQLVEKAGVNQVAIPYHFGGKEGLYNAVAETIVERFSDQVGPVLGELKIVIDAGQLSKEVAGRLLREVFHRASALIIASPEAEHWARFVVREQMDPSPAFDILYRGMFERLFGTVVRLLAKILDLDAADEQLQIRAFSLVGQFLVFRVGRSAVLRTLGWDDVGPDQLSAIQAAIDIHLDAILEKKD